MNGSRRGRGWSAIRPARPRAADHEKQKETGIEMKKSEKSPDLAGVVAKIEERLAVIDRKVDTLINRTSERSTDTRPYPNPFQRYDQARRPEEQRQQNGAFNQRQLYKAVCADCSKDCEVPFKPTGDRPVYCKECFAKRRQSGSRFKPSAHPAGAANVAVVQKARIEKPQKAEPAKGSGKKKAATKKKKKG